MKDERVIEPTEGGVLLSIRVIPRAGKSAVAGGREGALVVRLKAPPVDGAANEELVELLARTLAVPSRSVTIVSGTHGRRKRVRVVGIDVLSATSCLLDRPRTK